MVQALLPGLGIWKSGLMRDVGNTKSISKGLAGSSWGIVGFAVVVNVDAMI